MHSQILIIYLYGCFINHKKREIVIVNNSHFIFIDLQNNYI
jgi:hypothetical protein